jgi:hypothetical protein
MVVVVSTTGVDRAAYSSSSPGGAVCAAGGESRLAAFFLKAF